MIKYLPFGENLVKISPVDPEIILLKDKKMKLMQAEHIGCGAGVPGGLNKVTVRYCCNF